MTSENRNERERVAHDPRVRVVPPRAAAERDAARMPAGAADFAPIFSSKMTLHECEGETPRPGECQVAMLQRAYLRIVEHLSADTSREHGGLLLGFELRSPTGPPMVVITHSLPARHTKGTPTSLSFEQETWVDFEEHTDRLTADGVELQRVGWYHSHPDIAIFLSQWDLDVCTNFPRPNQVALVVDPVKDNGGFFVRSTGGAGLRPHSPQGFIELHDLSEKSLVTWKNMTPFEVRAAGGSLDAAVVAAERASGRAEDTGAKTLQIGRGQKRGLLVPYWAAWATGAAVLCLMAAVVTAAVIASEAGRQAETNTARTETTTASPTATPVTAETPAPSETPISGETPAEPATPDATEGRPREEQAANSGNGGNNKRAATNTRPSTATFAGNPGPTGGNTSTGSNQNGSTTTATSTAQNSNGSGSSPQGAAETVDGVPPVKAPSPAPTQQVSTPPQQQTKQATKPTPNPPPTPEKKQQPPP